MTLQEKDDIFRRRWAEYTMRVATEHELLNKVKKLENKYYS